jgi:UDP-4-amino-4-deoxy-L-arabinose-oxoglutarate aminotransferase
MSEAAVFSFYAKKNLTCGEGGAIATNDDEMANRLGALRLHGVDTYAKDQHRENVYRHWDMTTLGYKCNMHDLSAGLLLAQLPDIETRRRHRMELAKRYDDLLSDLDSITLPETLPNSTHGHHLYTIRSNPKHRDHLLTELSRKGVGVGVNFRTVHLMEYYRKRFGYQRGAFPKAELIGNSTISLPLYPSLSEKEQRYVAKVLRQIIMEI